MICCDVCPKVYHLQCSGLDDPNADFVCPWHSCNRCCKDLSTTAAKGLYCVACTTSYCFHCAEEVGINEKTLYSTTAAIPVPDAFRVLRRNGFLLNNSDSRLYVCADCTSSTDGSVAHLYGFNEGTAMNVKRDLAIAHKKLTDRAIVTDGGAAAVLDSPSKNNSRSTSDAKVRAEDAADLGMSEAVLRAQEVPAVRDFLGDLTRRSATMMKRQGWVLLPQVRHELVGQRTRRFFPRQGHSDGSIVGYLPARLNEGLALLHCVHDDGDTEDLEEREAETAVEDFKSNFTKVSDSKKSEARRKQMRQRRLDKVAAAAHSLRELGKKIPVECLGYQVEVQAPQQAAQAASHATASSSAAKPAELVVLKRFRDTSEAALALLTCWESQAAGDADGDGDGEGDAANGTVTATGGAGKGGGGVLSTVLGRSRIAEMKKGILRCCQGLDQGSKAGAGGGRSPRNKKGAPAPGTFGSTFLGFKWQFALPELPPEPTSDVESGEDDDDDDDDDEEDGPKAADGDEDDNADEEGGKEGVEVEVVETGPRRVKQPRRNTEIVAVPLTLAAAAAVASGAVCEDLADVSASGKRQRGPSGAPVTSSTGIADTVDMDIDVVRRLRACPELARIQSGLRLADVPLEQLVAVAAEYFSESDSESDADSGSEVADDDAEDSGAAAAAEGGVGASPALKRLWTEDDDDVITMGKRSSRARHSSSGRAGRRVEEDEFYERKVPALGDSYQATVAAFDAAAAARRPRGAGAVAADGNVGDNQVWNPEPLQETLAAANGNAGGLDLDAALREAVLAQLHPGLVFTFIRPPSPSAVGDSSSLSASSGASAARRTGFACTVKPPAPGDTRVTVRTNDGRQETAEIPLEWVCPPIGFDAVFQTLQASQYKCDETVASVGRITKMHFLSKQWAASDMSVLLDSPYLASGRLRDLIRHMRAHRQSIKASEVVHHFFRMRREHIYDDAADAHKDRDRDAASLAVAEALGNPSSAQLTQSLKVEFLREKGAILALFRHADSLLADHPGRQEHHNVPTAPSFAAADASAQNKRAKPVGGALYPQAAASSSSSSSTMATAAPVYAAPRSRPQPPPVNLANGVAPVITLMSTVAFTSSLLPVQQPNGTGAASSSSSGGVVATQQASVTLTASSALAWDLPINDHPPPLSVFEMDSFVQRFQRDPALSWPGFATGSNNSP